MKKTKISGQDVEFLTAYLSEKADKWRNSIFDVLHMNEHSKNKTVSSYPDLLAREYESLLQTSHSSEYTEDRIEKILKAAIDNEQLNSLIRDVDAKFASTLESFSDEDLQQQANLLPIRLDSIDQKIKREKRNQKREKKRASIILDEKTQLLLPEPKSSLDIVFAMAFIVLTPVISINLATSLSFLILEGENKFFLRSKQE